MATTTHTTSPAALYTEWGRLRALYKLPHTPDTLEQVHIRLYALEEAMLHASALTMLDMAAKIMLIRDLSEDEQTNLTPFLGSLLTDLHRLTCGGDTLDRLLAHAGPR